MKEYIKFKKGYFYKFTDGTAFYVDDICDCEMCKKRGFQEPMVYWLNYVECSDNPNNNPDYICSRNEYFSNIVSEESNNSNEPWIKKILKNSCIKKVDELQEEINETLNEYAKCLDYYNIR